MSGPDLGSPSAADLVAGSVSRTLASAFASVAQKLLADARHLEGGPRKNPNRRRKAARRRMCQPLDGAEVPLDFSPAIRHLEILMRWSDDFPGDQPIVSDDAERLRRAADILEGAEPTSEEAASPWIQYLLSERRDGDGAPSTLRFVAALFFDAPISNDTFRSRLDRAVEIVEGSPLTPDEEGEEWATLAFDAHRLTLSGPTASTSPAE